jgi:hypothetical protein
MAAGRTRRITTTKAAEQGHSPDCHFAGASWQQVMPGRWQEGMMTEMIGVCGDDCSLCPRYMATKAESAGELEKVKELWVRLKWREPDFPAQNLSCHGCKTEARCAYSELRTCARERAVDNCGLCHGYPCELINAVFDKSEKVQARSTQVCTPNEMSTLERAFFSKKQILDRIHGQMKERK